MERASRLLVLTSSVVAFFTYVWLLDWIAGMQVAAVVLFVCGLVLGRVDFDRATGAIAATAFVIPALLPFLLGTQDFHGLMIWIAFALGALLARADAHRWSVPRPWRWPLATWVMLIAVTWPIIVARELDFSLVAAATLDTPNGIAAPAPRLTAGWIAHAVTSQLLGLLWFDLLWHRFARNISQMERTLLRPLVAGAALGAVVAVYQGTIDLQFLNGGIWPNLRRASGLMLDANAFGLGAALCAPLAIALAWRGMWPLSVGLALAGLLAAGMWFGGSRTALLAFTLGGLGALVAAADRRGAWHARYIPIALLLGGALLVLAIFLAPRGGNSPSPLQRVFDRLPTPDGPSIARFVNEMWGRFGYGPAAVAMIREHPVAGVGVASFHVLGSDYIYRAERRIVPADNAQNWWRHYLAELGLIGAIAPFICSFLLLRLVWSSPTTADRHEALTVTRGVIAGLGAASLLGVPVQHPAIWLLAASVIYWATALSSVPDRSLGIEAHRAGRPTRLVWALAAVLVSICTLLQAYDATHGLRVPVRAQRTGFPYLYGLTPDRAEGFPDVRRTAAVAVAVIPAQRSWLELHAWAPHATTSTPVALRILVDDVVILDTDTTRTTPITRYVAVSPGFVRLEFETNPTDAQGQGVTVAHRWVDRPPAAARAEEIITGERR